MEKRILFPTDFSQNSINAIKYALKLYDKQKCFFYFLNAFQVFEYYTSEMLLEDVMETTDYINAENTSEIELENLIKTIQVDGKNQNHTYYRISIYDSLTHAVKEVVIKKDVDLVIMGTKGATYTESIWFGTNTSAVMKYVNSCPFLIIPEGYKISPLKEIVFATDYDVIFKRRKLEIMLEIAKMHHSIINVLHIENEKKLNETQKSNKELLESILQDQKHAFHTLKNIKILKGINTFIESRGSNMLVQINKKSRLFGSKLSKPITKEVERYLTIPMLVLFD